MLVLVEDRVLASEEEAGDRFMQLLASDRFARIVRNKRRVKAYVEISGGAMKDCIFRNAQTRLSQCSDQMLSEQDVSEHEARIELVTLMAELLREAGAKVDTRRLNWRLMTHKAGGGK